MRKLCAFIFLFGILQYCISCQKEYSTENRTRPDSLTLVKTIRLVHYDPADQFDWEERQTITYNLTLHQTTVDIIDSGASVTGGVQRWTEIFDYDAQDRLSAFTSTSSQHAATQIDFTYDAAGNLSLASIDNQWLGKTVECRFAHSTQNGQKKIVMYDTAGNYVTNTDTRPQITTYRFNSDGQLLQETVFYTVFKRQQNWFEDTTDTRSYFDNAGYMNKQVINFAYRFSQVSAVTDYARDSTEYTREGTHTEMSNSFKYIYKNLYWFSISESPSGFANTLNLGAPTYTGPAIKTAEYWQSYPPNPVILNHVMGNFVNTFDAKGLLTKAVYPKGFANSAGGKNEVFYTYTKLPK